MWPERRKVRQSSPESGNGDTLGFGFERGEHAALVIDREVAHITIKHDAKRIAFNEFGARAAAMHGEPSGHTAQVGRDAAVLGGHECNDATERQALSVDQRRQMPCAEVFGNAAMDREALLFAVVALKQAAGQRIEQWPVAGGGKLAPETVLIVHRVVVEGKARDTREQLHGAEETCRVEPGVVRPCAGARRRTALRVEFAHQLPAGEFVGLAATVGPAFANSASQQSQRLRVA